MATVAKTFKLDQATIDKLTAVMEGSGLSWDGTFAMLASQHEAEEAARATGRETEMADFMSIVGSLTDAYASALTINANTESRVRAEFEKRIASNEAAVSALQEKLSAAIADARDAQSALKDAQAISEQERKRADKAEAEAGQAREAAEKAEQQVAYLLNDNTELKAQAESLKADAERGQAAEQEKARADALAAALEEEKKRSAELEKAMKDELAKKLAEEQSRNEEHMKLVLARAEVEKNAAVLQARQEAAKEADALREHLTELLEKAKPKATKPTTKKAATSRKKTETEDEGGAS